jgi:hypothetical protein
MSASPSIPNWPELEWHEVIDRVSPCVFRIETDQSAGTGFVFSMARTPRNGRHYTMVATAWHVLRDSVDIASPLTLISSDGQREWRSTSDNIGYTRLGDEAFDTALVMVESAEPLMEDLSGLLPILPVESHMARGAEVGWLGFPGIAEPELCFFTGVISGYLNNPPGYLVDGVAINGVSGGPVFVNRCHLIGMMTAYIPNQIDKGMTLPGLSAVTPINAIRLWAEEHLGAAVIKK